MNFNRIPGYVALLLLAAAMAGCSNRGAIRRTPGAPSTLFEGVEGSTVTNVGIGAGNTSSYLVLPSNDIVVTIQISDTAAMLRRYSGDSLHTLWSTSYRAHESDDGDEARAMLYNHEDAIGLITTAREGRQLVTIGRIFDRATGALRKDTILARTDYLEGPIEERNRIGTDRSPKGEYTLVRIAGSYIDARAYEIDALLLRGDLTPVTRRRVRFNHVPNEVLQDVQVDDEGNLFLASQTAGNTIRVMKLRMLGEERSQKLSVSFGDEGEPKERLTDCSMTIEDPNTVRVMAGRIQDWSLKGVVVATLDFRHDTVANRRLVPISEAQIGAPLMGSSILTPAFLHGCLVRQSSPSYMMVFEELLPLQLNPDRVQCNNVLMVGLERNGALKWCSGFLKSQLDESGSFATGSFQAQLIDEQTMRVTYPVLGRLAIRDFRLTDGALVAPGPARSIATIGDGSSTSLGSFLRKTITWLDERTMVVGVSLNEPDGEDVKLCRIEL